MVLVYDKKKQPCIYVFHAGIDFDEFLKMYKRLFIQCRTVISGDVSDLVNSHKVGGSGSGWEGGGEQATFTLITSVHLNFVNIDSKKWGFFSNFSLLMGKKGRISFY